MFCFRVLGCLVFDLECFVFDFKGASFSTYRVLRFRPWVLRGSVFVFDTTIAAWRFGVVALENSSSCSVKCFSLFPGSNYFVLFIHSYSKNKPGKRTRCLSFFATDDVITQQESSLVDSSCTLAAGNLIGCQK